MLINQGSCKHTRHEVKLMKKKHEQHYSHSFEANNNGHAKGPRIEFSKAVNHRPQHTTGFYGLIATG
jgi:hypothetical protein